MSEQIIKAKVLKDDRKVLVCKLKKGGFCNFQNRTEKFKKEELDFNIKK